MRKFLSLVLLSVCTVASADDITPIKTTLSEQEQRLVAQIDEWQDLILEELQIQVGMNTGTANIEGLDKYRDYLQGNSFVCANISIKLRGSTNTDCGSFGCST